MFVLTVVSPGLGLRAPNEIPHTLGPQTDLLATLAVLIIGLVFVAFAIRSVTR